MRIKELKRTVNVSWSPTNQHPLMLAAGSAAQQVDASFSSSSFLELYSLNLEEPGLDLKLISSLQTQHKFQKIVWSGTGVLVGGCDGGLLEFYSTEKLMRNDSDSLLSSNSKHSGHVSALDINPYQQNLLASGASESEIFIWDLNNTSQPMAPGNRSQPHDHVQDLAWNQEVQHILGSTFASRCVVWDLRKNEPIMKLSDSQSRTRWRSMSWHPSVATQLCIASEDDQVPVVQLWDLRLAASPLVTLESHHKGVLAVSWCKHDPDLFLSAGKDGRVLCWNPNNTRPGGELLVELSQQPQWVFDVSWSPRDPNLFVTSSFDQSVTVHTLLGGSKPEISSHEQSNIMDSFGGVDSFNQLPVVNRTVDPQPMIALPQLPKPPSWLKKPVAAKFAFGGKLVTFEKCPNEAGSQKLVYISQVVSEPEIVELAAELDIIVSSDLTKDPTAASRLAELCRQKGDVATEQNERYTWFFLRANFLPTFKTEILNLLGFKQDEIPSKFKSGDGLTQQVPNDVAALSRGESTETDAEVSTDTSTDFSDTHTLIERKLANVDLGTTAKNIFIPNGDDTTSLICRALVCGNLQEAVEFCLTANRVSDALIIASLGSQELMYKVQKYHINQCASDPVCLLAGTLLQSKWEWLVQSSSTRSWRQVLASIVTHCEGEAISQYCEILGDRLSAENDPSLRQAASLCYLVSMSQRAVGAVLERDSDSETERDRAILAALTQLAAQARGTHLQSCSKVQSVLSKSAARLASQGCLRSALSTLDTVTTSDLKERLMHALGHYQQRRPSHASRYQAQHQLAGRSRTTSGHTQQRVHLAGPNDLTHNYNTVVGAGVRQLGAESNVWQQMVPPHPTAPAGPHHATPSVAAPTLPPPPPRPSSVGSQSGGITSRSKYKVDPSVAAPAHNQYGYNNPTTQSYGGYNSPLPDQFANPSVMGQLAPVNPTGAMNTSFSQPLNTSVNQAINQPSNPVSGATVNGSYYNPSASAEPTFVPPPPAHNKPAAAGWNDPPMLTSTKPKPKQEAQAPITHPLFGVEPPQHVPLVPTQQYPGQQYTNQQYTNQQYTNQQYTNQQYTNQQYSDQQYTNQQYTDQQFPGQYDQQQQYTTPYPATMPSAHPQQAESPLPPEPVPAVKPPIPEQYQALQTVFDRLMEECSSRATAPQVKRKLDDVHRRLETLYDILRESRLSETALSSLHVCSEHVQRGDYGSALESTAALASSPDFAAVAAFLPGLKALFQLAMHLQIYIR